MAERPDADPRFSQAKADQTWWTLGSERDKQDRKAAAFERRLFDEVKASGRLYPDADEPAPRHVSRQKFPTPEEVIGGEARWTDLSNENIAAMDEGF